MKVMIDTNIFISAALFPEGRAAKALYKAMVEPYQPVTCDYVVDELRRKFRENMLKESEKTEYVFDEDNPILSKEELSQFKRESD